MRVLVLGALRAGTGNEATCLRLASHLETPGAELFDCHAFRNPGAFRELIERREVSAAIGCHALLAGPILARTDLPYALVLGGTDIFEYSRDAHWMGQMERPIHTAKRVICFSPAMAASAVRVWPALDSKIRCIPQSVAIDPAPHAHLRRELGLGADAKLILLPCGMRPVKDPLFLAEAVSTWHAQDPRVHLVIVGPELLPDYAAKVRARAAELPGVHLHPELERRAMHGAMLDADLVANSSVSEGMSTTILEAMKLGVPVLARFNSGNASIVHHWTSGVLFAEPAEFVDHARTLLGSPSLRRALTQSARYHVFERHGFEAERGAYQQIARELMAGGS